MKLRKYQVSLNKPTKAFLKSNVGDRGQVYAPTGAGKTVCFTELVKWAITRGARNIAIVHPRIALSQDQLRRTKEELGQTIHYTSFHSGTHVAGDESIKEINTTCPDTLSRIIAHTDRPHITFSSYDSFDKIVDQPFDILICDEAHNLVQPQFLAYLNHIVAKKTIFYTATPITNAMEGLMFDESLFGPVIAYVEPKELIIGGYIVAPQIQVLDCTTTRSADKVDVVDTIARAYIEQYRVIVSRGMPYHQMLVSARGVSTDLRAIETDVFRLQSTIQSAVGVEVDVYTVEAANVWCNGRSIGDRAAAIERIKASGRNVIVAHYDTLAEGIDIGSLSGCVLMRKLSKAKTIQTIGRQARPYGADLDPITREPNIALYDPANGIDNRAKPRCLITLPVIDGEWIGGDITPIAEAFIAGGYDDLATMMATTEDTATGREVIFSMEDESVVRSQIIDHQVRNQLEDLATLLGV